jgi:hypothetical protein
MIPALVDSLIDEEGDGTELAEELALPIFVTDAVLVGVRELLLLPLAEWLRLGDDLGVPVADDVALALAEAEAELDEDGDVDGLGVTEPEGVAVIEGDGELEAVAVLERLLLRDGETD